MKLNRFFTKSKVFLYLNLGFIFGIFLGRYLKINLLFISILIFISLILSLFSKKFLIFPFTLCLFTFGLYYYQKSSVIDQSSKSLIYFNDQGKQTFTAVITTNPYLQNGSQKFVVKGKNLKGKVLVTTFAYPTFIYGDELEIKGKLKTPPEFEDFSYRDYLALQGVHSICYLPEIQLVNQGQGNLFYRLVYRLKNFLEQKVNYILPEPHAAFLNGLLFGSRKSIPENLMNDFNTTGLTHIIAISGWNITIIANLLMKVFGFLPRRFSFWVIVVGISFFAIFVGGQAAVVRAALMGILTFWAIKSGRLKGVTNGVVLAGTIMLLINPSTLHFDVGFQLSFLATLGILYFHSWLEKLLRFLPNFFQLRETLTVTSSAQVLVLPFILYQFKRIALITPLANLLVLPLIPYAMLLGFAANLVAIIWEQLGRLVGFGAFLILDYIILVIRFCAGFKFASIEVGEVPWLVIVSYYLVLMMIYFLVNRRKNAFTQ